LAWAKGFGVGTISYIAGEEHDSLEELNF
jgi:hypothetical protein